jgi:hypothetical protein
MGKQLAKRGIVPESVYNVDETGVLLSDLNIVRVLVSRSDVQSCCSVGLRRTMIDIVALSNASWRMGGVCLCLTTDLRRSDRPFSLPVLTPVTSRMIVSYHEKSCHWAFLD